MDTPRIVVLDGVTLNPGDNPWDEVEALGEVTVYERTPEPHVVGRAAGAQILLTNKTPISGQAIRSLPELRFIGVLATGYNIVDIQAARRRNIPVSNIPEYGTDSVAQHVMALLLELANGVGRHDRAVHEGRWSESPDFCFWESGLTELAGKTMAIIGFGRIGRRVGELAHALGMVVMAFDPARSDPPHYRPFSWVKLEEAFRSADVISLNCPLTPENEGFIDAAALRRMKPTTWLINASRGPLVREADLAAALRRGTIAGAAVDVLSGEPPSPDNPLLSAPNCIITPHVAWASLEARKRLMAETAANVAAFLTGSPRNVVNP